MARRNVLLKNVDSQAIVFFLFVFYFSPISSGSKCVFEYANFKGVFVRKNVSIKYSKVLSGSNG